MKYLNIRYLFLLSLLFSFDLFRPFGYSLSAEVLFLGVIFISLNENLLPALILSTFFGLFSDLFGSNIKPLRAIEFPFICFLNHYLISFFHFTDKGKRIPTVESSLVLLALITHLTFNSLCTGLLLPLFWIKFLIQSSLIYICINYFLNKNTASGQNRPLKSVFLK